MAHGYLEFFAKSRLKIFSAGIEVHGVNSTAIKIMKEDKIDISNYSSNHVDEYLHIDFDYIITVCDHAKESCPLFDVNDAIKIHKISLILQNLITNQNYFLKTLELLGMI